MNLGCGHRPLAGFVNIDGEANERSKPDLVCNLAEPLPYEDNSVDEIHAYHLFEHFYRFECEAILKDWTRALKPGGLMVLEMPCLDSVIAGFNHYIKRGESINPQLTLWGLFGDPSYKSIPMTHKWCYSKAELGQLMQAAGMTVSFHKAQTHFAIRDMRAEGIKCIAAT